MIVYRTLWSSRYPTAMKLFKVRQMLCSARTLFSQTGEWDPKFTLNMKKDIEAFWKTEVSKRKVNDCGDKMYILAMFPYPSGNLHLGHVRVYTIGDLVARYHTLRRKHVIYPIGWDSFGLPAENAAIERGEDPNEWTRKNIASMSSQLRELNYSFDWDREISTCDPTYYKWTQFLFVKLFEKGLVYRSKAIVNWDPVDNTTLADEQVDAEGKSWRSGAKVEKRLLDQWFIRTTEYSRRLYEGLDGLEGWEDIIAIQKGWIGDVDEGTYFDFSLEGDFPIKEVRIWTDRPELMAGTAFILVNDHHLLAELLKTNQIHAVNPFTQKRVPIFLNEKQDEFAIPKSTGASACVPCASEKEAEFASRNNIPFVNILDDEGNIVNTEHFNGSVDEARMKVLEFAKAKGIGGLPFSRNLKDWLISRQRYWGTPIPIVHCEQCGPVPIPEEDLPLRLPLLSRGQKLSDIHEWMNVSCPKCGSPATRETDTMDTFVDSSWYFLRFLDPSNSKALSDSSIARAMMPVDLYIGGLEHAVMHLYYARFIAHFLHNELGIGSASGPEPFKRMIVQGMVLNETFRVESTGEYIHKDKVDLSVPSKPKLKGTNQSVSVEWDKMSKSKHNGITPQEITDKYGIDTTRLFILGDYGPTSRYKWPSPAFKGLAGWQDKLWMTVDFFRQSRTVAEELINAEHEHSCWVARNEFIKNCNYHFEVTHYFNLILRDMQIYTNSLRSGLRCSTTFLGPQYERALGDLIICLAPFCPHFASELWAGFSDKLRFTEEFVEGGVFTQRWPELDQSFPLDLKVKVNDDHLFTVKLNQEDHSQLTKVKALQLVDKDLPPELKGTHSEFTLKPKCNALLKFNNVKFKIMKKKMKRKSQ